jgi:glycosyltransferase involved in cell wall biosynthesis
VGGVNPRISVVVPTRDATRTLEACLASIRAQRDTDVELIVVDNHSADGTVAVARRFAHRVIVAGPERSAQRNAGLAAATAEWIAFIDADMVLTPEVCRQAVDLLGADDTVGGVVVPERSFGHGFLARCRALEKELYHGVPDVEAARVFPTAVVRRVGGYREDLVAGEDWDLSDRVEATGLRIARTEAVIWHDDGHIELRTTFRKKRYYGRTFARYVATRAPGRPRRLARPAVLRRPGLLLRRPVLASGLVVLKAVEATGLAVGFVAGRRALG